MTHVRMDKWLWAARFFKTRSLAARACELGRIESNGKEAKSSREVRVGDLLQVKNDGGDFQVEVVHGCAHPVGSMFQRNPAQFPDRILQPLSPLSKVSE